MLTDNFHGQEVKHTLVVYAHAEKQTIVVGVMFNPAEKRRHTSTE